MTVRRRYRCHLYSHVLPAWLPVAKRPNGAMPPYHLSQEHPDHVGLYPERMRTECIATVAAEAYEVVE
jgi:hypothetical protein